MNLRAGESAVFFTHGIHYGDGLVVSELGNIPPEPAVESQVSSAAQSHADDALTQRLAQAELVISSVASAPAPFHDPSAPLGRRVSEHDPQWWQSIIKVSSVEKGTYSGETKAILFPNSKDIAWHASPKVWSMRPTIMKFNAKLFSKFQPKFRPRTQIE